MREENTVKAYMVAYHGWVSWATAYSLQILPANSLSFALYLLHKVQMGHHASSIKSAFYGIKFVHKGSNHPDPTENQVVQNMLEVGKRLCRQTINKKEPLETSHIHQLHETLICSASEKVLTKLRTFTLILLGFCGFMRYSELSTIQAHDVFFCTGYLKIFIEKSKTDIYREGKWLYISAANTVCCPVATLRRYFDLAQISEFSTEFIFRGIQSYPKQKKELLRKCNKPLSYTRARELMLDAVESIGLTRKAFGLHSLRSGGATAAANAGVNDRLFKRHCRWVSETAKDGYEKS